MVFFFLGGGIKYESEERLFAILGILGKAGITNIVLKAYHCSKERTPKKLREGLDKGNDKPTET